ncbi:hypothetical protein [Natronomonas gomsonensis]|uniref:hypothetical protein n=1 Tax=Natronomonas gomsonensis TaxID=1046043 RepID=UPI0015BB9AAC|nr:hypothetical protein [Natronomonas gomsonensis]
MTNDDDGKEPYPEGVEATEGWPEGDVELPYDEDADPEEWMESYPDDLVDGDESDVE